MIFSRSKSEPQLDTGATIESLANRLIKEWPKTELEFVRSEGFDHMARSMVLRWIRNECGLWSPDHPLTSNWHQNPGTRNIVYGVDYSLDHPDNIAALILDRIQTSSSQ